MKKQLKTKNTSTQRNKKNTGRKTHPAYLSKKSRVNHIKIAPKNYSGKLISSRNTSYLILVALLMVAALFLYLSKKLCNNENVLGINTVSVTATVPSKKPVNEQLATNSDSQINNYNNSTETTSNGSPKQPIDDYQILPEIEKTFTKDNQVWFVAMIPFYYAILSLTLGFWMGNLFNQKFGKRKK